MNCEHRWEMVYYPKWSPNGGLWRKRCKLCGYDEE